MSLSASCVSWGSLVRFGGVPKHRRGADGGWGYCHLCDGHKPVGQPEGPEGAPGRSAQGLQQRRAAELLERAEGSAHTAGWWWGSMNVCGIINHFVGSSNVCSSHLIISTLYFKSLCSSSVIPPPPDIFYVRCSFEAAPHHPFLWAWVGPGWRWRGERGSGREGREDQSKSPGCAGVQHELTADHRRGTSCIVHQELPMS